MSEIINESLANCYEGYKADVGWTTSGRALDKASIYAMSFDTILTKGWTEDDTTIKMILKRYYKSADAEKAFEYSYFKGEEYNPVWKFPEGLTFEDVKEYKNTTDLDDKIIKPSQTEAELAKVEKKKLKEIERQLKITMGISRGPTCPFVEEQI